MIDIRESVSLKEYHTFGIDVSAKYFVEYTTVSQLKEVLISKLLKENKMLHIGSGSNLLFTKDYDGVILHSKMQLIEVVGESDTTIDIKAQSGVNWDSFVEYCVEKGLGGVENLSHIPGEVGASAIQNVGAYGVEAKDVIVSVETISVEDATERIFTNSECRYAYRDSIFKGELKGKYIVTAVVYRLQRYPKLELSYGNLSAILDYNATVKCVRDAIISTRRAKLPEPKEIGSAGSFFVNPVVSTQKFNELKSKYPNMPSYPAANGNVKLSAAWLIDKAGWHGKTCGGAALYPKQCLVIINSNNATAQDIVTLAADIAQSIYHIYGVTITPEVNYI